MPTGQLLSPPSSFTPQPLDFQCHGVDLVSGLLQFRLESAARFYSLIFVYLVFPGPPLLYSICLEFGDWIAALAPERSRVSVISPLFLCPGFPGRFLLRT
jgi:hypothetical protein